MTVARNHRGFWLRCVLAVFAMVALDIAAPAVAQQLPTLMNISPAVAAARPSLTTERALLQKERSDLHGSFLKFNADCSAVNERDAAKVTSCLGRKQTLKTALDRHIARSEAFNHALGQDGCGLDNKCVIDSMTVLVKRMGWNSKKQERVSTALNNLFVEGGFASSDTKQTWYDVLKRGMDGEIAQQASQGEGPGFPGSGEQHGFQDCAVFALANAAGLPYSVVGARATELIKQGEWRSADERAHPQDTIEKKGLIGGEVVILAEAFGSAKAVGNSDFAKNLKDGHRILLDVVPANGDSRNAHEVVLSKTFQRNGSTWYEMMDSSQGPTRRLYLSEKELISIQKEVGVVFSPEPGSTPKLLR